MTRHLVAAVLAFVWLCAPAWAEQVRVTLLHFNDIYEFQPGADSGGFPGLATVIARERAAHPGAVLTFGGDLLSPSVASSVTQGAHMIDLLNALAPAAAVPGNHELDFGAAVMRARMGESAFPWLVTNMDEADGAPFGGGRKLLLLDANGVKVGLFGLLTSETGHLAAGAADIRFHPEQETARAAVAELRRQGAELVVALTHQDVARDLELSRGIKGIDLILGGHDHHVVTLQEGGPPIIKAGHDGVYLAAVDMIVDREAGREPQVRAAGWRLLSTLGEPADPAMAARADRHAQAVGAGLDQPLAVLDTPLDSRQEVTRGAESSLGDVVADALRAATGAHMALVNGGGLRGNRLYESGTALTRGDLLREMPFGNLALVLEVSGEQVRAALEHGVSKAPARSGRFPQVSGLSFTYDPAAAPGRRVGAIAIGGKALDPAARYRLATSDYLAGGGDGYAMLSGAKVLGTREAAPLLANTVMEQVQRLGRVAVTPGSRIRIP